MGREVRRVPKDWRHPLDKNGHFVPLHYQDWHGEYEYFETAWINGQVRDYGSADPRALKEKGGKSYYEGTYASYAGPRPTPETYMPDWPDEERTHLQMYETCSEGTPISPVVETPEELARWLADNSASAFGSMTASNKHWLAVAKGEWAPSAVVDSVHGLRSGVEALEKDDSLGGDPWMNVRGKR